MTKIGRLPDLMLGCCGPVLRQVGLFLLLLLPMAGLHTVAALQDSEIPEEGKLAIEMQPFDFTMFDRGRTVGKVSLTLTLVVQEQGDSEMIRTRMPQIRSDFLGALTVLARQRFDVNRPIDPDIVTAYLTPFLEHRIGAGKALIFVKQALISPR